MEKSLLLGNGINMHFSVEKFTLNEITNRFAESLKNSSTIFDLLFEVSISESVIYETIQKSGNECPFNTILVTGDSNTDGLAVILQKIL